MSSNPTSTTSESSATTAAPAAAPGNAEAPTSAAPRFPIADFKVHDVKLGDPMKAVDVQSGAMHKAWLRAVAASKSIMALSPPDTDATPVACVDENNMFAYSVYLAFYKHYPLRINPNAVWITIAQGFAKYVEKNAEALRSKFVDFEGKKKLLVIREDFHYGDKNNDWQSVFPEFTSQIEQHIGKKTVDILGCNFSNSTITDAAVSHIVLMDTMKQYFSYGMMCGCGIPSIQLLGVPDDWRAIRSKIDDLAHFCHRSDETLATWLETMRIVLDFFVEAAEGHPDIAFFGSVCNLAGLSGMIGSPVTGWVQCFFPYIEGHPNGGLSCWRGSFEAIKKDGADAVLRRAVAAPSKRNFGAPFGYGISLEDLPSGVSTAPVHIEWLDVNKSQDVKFCGGLSMLYQHSDLSIEARTGWAVIE